jgi:Xaa-Pro aminopeptidase
MKIPATGGGRYSSSMTAFPAVWATSVIDDRLDRVRTAARKANCEVLFVTPGPDLMWLSGYDAHALERLTCLVVPTVGEAFLVCPELEAMAAGESPVARLGVDIVGWAETADPYALIADRLIGDGKDAPHTVGLANRMWAEQVLRFGVAFPDAHQLPASAILGPLRMRKDPAEIEALSRAAAAIDRVHAQMADFLIVGQTERDAARAIGRAILDSGHRQVDFIIVASGPNGASPHHNVSDRTLKTGDVVVVDIGGTTPEGYCSDCTRTYVLGEPPADFIEYYDPLRAAQDAACAAVRPGVPAAAIDATARSLIDEAGYGAEFLHRLGHGIGVETHEHPYIVASNEAPLEQGMAFSVEPGIYMSGRHGARIEDIMIVTDTGGRRLNTLDHAYGQLDG